MIKVKHNLRMKLNIIVTLIIVTTAFLYFENNAIKTNSLTINSTKLPQNFHGYRIVHLSDLHGKSFGKNQSKLVKRIKNLNPDIIVFTGDLIDSRRYNEKHSLVLMEEITKISPVYYVTGNHEWKSGKFKDLEEGLINKGVNVLRNEALNIEKGNDSIGIVGIDDPLLAYRDNYGYKTEGDIVKTILDSIPNDDSFKILLSHRPEFFSIYAQYDFDMIFAGHAHGGQIRVPFIGGLIAPGQGLLPKYTAGKYIEENSAMVVSRGLGNSIFPQRVFNRPEIIVVELSR